MAFECASTLESECVFQWWVEAGRAMSVDVGAVWLSCFQYFSPRYAVLQVAFEWFASGV